jgi:hypothetical protein
VEYVKQKWTEAAERDTRSGSATVPTVSVDIGPATQMLLGTAGRVAGIRIVKAGQVPKTIQPGGPTAVGNGQQVQVPPDQPTVEIPVENTPTAPPQQNAWNNAQEAPPYQAPPTPQVEETHWGHNGSSQLKLESNGASRRFYYIEPRIGLIEVGVAQGMVAFEGTQSGNIYTGTAYVFSKVCGATGKWFYRAGPA